MEITFAGRDMELRLEHFLIVFMELLIVALAATAIVAAVTLATAGTLDQDALLRNSSLASGAIAAVSAPVSALLFLWLAGLLRLKKDEGLCRSLASAEAILAMAIGIAGDIALVVLLALELDTLYLISLAISMLGSILSAAAGAIVVYLWLLIAMKPDRKRGEGVAGLSALFAVITLLAWKFAAALSVYYYGFGEAVTLGFEDVAAVAGNFLFAFAILYHTRMRKTNKDDAALFAVLYMGGNVLFGIARFVQTGDLEVAFIAGAALELALLHALANKDALKTF